MASRTAPYGAFEARPGTSHGSTCMTDNGSMNIHHIIDQHLETAINRIKNAHYELMCCRRSSNGPDSQPYLGVASYIHAVSSHLSELTTALTQEYIKKEASDFVFAQNEALFLMCNNFGVARIHKDKTQLERIHRLTTQYERSVGDTDEQSKPSTFERPSDTSSPRSKPARRPLPGPSSPMSMQSLSSVASSTGPLGSPDERNRLPNPARPRSSRDKSPPTLSDKDQFANYNLDRWKKRGKDAENYCPRKWDCKKGGVVNGQLVLFERNSAYIQHCNKHKRPFVCELPGCPNPAQRRNFARADGLRRHQDLVSHGVPCENGNTPERTIRNSAGSQESHGVSSRPYLKPEYDFSDPGSRDSEMEDAPRVKLDTG